MLANTNLDDGKQTKRQMLENVDIDYQNTLKVIYNMSIEEEDELENNPFFTAMKIPGVDYIPEEATDTDRTTEQSEIETA